VTTLTAPGSRQRTRRAGPLTYAAVAALLLVFGFFAYGSIGGSEIVPPTAAVLSGKATALAETTLANEVKVCGHQDGTIKSITYSAPPLQVTNVVVGPAMSAPGATFHLLAACVVTWLQQHGAGQGVLTCPAQAAGSARGDTADVRVAYIRNLISGCAAGG